MTRFQRTVQYLQDATPQQRSDFAATALFSLANAYAVEAKLARSSARKSGAHSGLWGWAATVDRYAAQLPLLLEDIELGLPVRLALTGDNALAITVADRTIVVSHPRLNEQGAFEQGILREFCGTHSCGQEQVAGVRDSGGGPIPVSTAQARADWSFTAKESLCSYEGITVRFDSARNLAHSRLICEQLLQEIALLTDELAWQQRHDVTIEWDQLELQSTPHQPEHTVRLNALGDTALVTVPMLYRSSGLLRQVLPWMRQRVNQQQDVSVLLNASDYGWQNP